MDFPRTIGGKQMDGEREERCFEREEKAKEIGGIGQVSGGGERSSFV